MKGTALKTCTPLPKCMRTNASTLMCTKGTNKEQKPCKGDSGATAFWEVRKKRAYFGLGVTSLPDDEKCIPSKSITYISVFAYLDWIKKYVKNLPKPFKKYVTMSEYAPKEEARKWALKSDVKILWHYNASSVTLFEYSGVFTPAHSAGRRKYGIMKEKEC
ncbi:peptidase S1 domain-containing protein [Trichonephila inaurata madagascariensis]|uniref:Peptidase S1 domain-containing protein n=1 Tax=Trichonephila inaurata madagascariensis TaxID=2747483 RepID=A0A8X6X253_9ARAC|nr:peptidase S1 domain-containing protein [Trichonephila inaurata madagascariensis]